MKSKRQSKQLNFAEIYKVYTLFYLSDHTTPENIQAIIAILYPDKIQLFNSTEEILDAVMAGLVENNMSLFIKFMNGLK